MRTNDHLTASLVIGFPPIFGEAYNSHVVLFKPNIITAVCTDMKLFHHLKTVWKSEDTEEGDSAQACLVDFAVSFAFKSSMHSYLHRGSLMTSSNRTSMHFSLGHKTDM